MECNLSLRASGKLNLVKRAGAVLVLCATLAIALRAQTFTTLNTVGVDPMAVLVQAANGDLYGHGGSVYPQLYRYRYLDHCARWRDHRHGSGSDA